MSDSEPIAESILEPGLPIVDAHHHLWDDRYRLEEFAKDLASGHRIAASVFVQCNWSYRPNGPEALRPVGETERVASVARGGTPSGIDTSVCAAIVGYADLRLGKRVDEVLEAHIEAAEGRFRGIRQPASWHQAVPSRSASPRPPGLLLDPDFRAGFARLGRFGLSFDAWLYHSQLDEAIDLARAFPDIAIVVDHAGGPLGIGPYRGRRDDVLVEWRSLMSALASCPNVWVKLGGLGMAIGGFDFHRRRPPPASGELADAWRPYIDWCIGVFGPARCMFESNFPVDRGTCSYQVLWNAFKRIVAGASAGEKSALFHDTAARFYRIAR